MIVVLVAALGFSLSVTALTGSAVLGSGVYVLVVFLAWFVVRVLSAGEDRS